MDIEIYDIVARKIDSKIPKINKVLLNCELDSKLAVDVTEEKVKMLLNINTTGILVKERSRKRYDLSKVSAMVKKLDIHAKQSLDMPKKKVRSESVSSLASDDSNRDYQTEIINHLKQIRKIIGSIQNTSIREDDGKSTFEAVTTFHNKFLQLVFGLQRIAKEMTIIASNDSISSDSLPLSFIDNNFINRLKQLDKCLDDLQKLKDNKNPVTNLEKKANLKLKYTAIINNILGTIERNPH